MRIREAIRKLIPQVDTTDENGNPIEIIDPTTYDDPNPRLETLRKAEEDGILTIKHTAGQVAVGLEVKMNGGEALLPPYPGHPAVREGHIFVTKFHRPPDTNKEWFPDNQK